MNNDPPATTPQRRNTRIGLAGVALLLALLALGLAAWAAWQAQRLQRAGESGATRVTQVESHIAAIERSLASDTSQQQALDRRLAAIESDLRAGHDTVQALDQRTSNLEAALGALSDQQLRGHDALLLDDAEFLLRAGAQRVELFHDVAGGLRAYTLAEQALAQVQDPAFVPARASVATERAMLSADAPPSRQHASDVLNALRTRIPSLPLRADGQAAPVGKADGTWSRLWHAFSGVLRIERDGSASLPAVDARFAHELAALDLAQAQAALLAFDEAGYRAALQRSDALLAASFDADSPDVRWARASLRELLSTPPPQPAPQLGGALATLRDLRATHALRSIAPPTAPGGGSRR